MKEELHPADSSIDILRKIKPFMYAQVVVEVGLKDGRVEKLEGILKEASVGLKVEEPGAIKKSCEILTAARHSSVDYVLIYHKENC